MQKTVRSQSPTPQRTGAKVRLGKGRTRTAKRPKPKLYGIFKDVWPDLPLERFIEAKAIWPSHRREPR